LQEFPFIGWEVIEPPSVKFLEPLESEVGSIPVMWSPTIRQQKIVGLLSKVKGIKTFEVHPWERYAISDDHGRNLAYLITRSDFVWLQPLNSPNAKKPHIMVDTNACNLIHKWLRSQSEIIVSASFKCKRIERLTARNLLATPPTGTYDIIVGAHYDSVPNTVGAHDNASGVATLISLAASQPDGVRLIAFDAEEWNKFGSVHYVNAAKASGELNKVRLMINIDSVGFGDRVYLLTSCDVEKAVRSAIRISPILSTMEIEVISKGDFPQFDSWPFMKNGIPIIQIGTKGNVDYDYFHHPKDTIDKLNHKLERDIPVLLGELIRRLRQVIQKGR
jgi:hypothetical protein